MAHVAIFKKFDEMKIGDVFTMTLDNYKSYESAKGTISKAASEYRRERNPDFYISTVRGGVNYVKVQRVNHGITIIKTKFFDPANKVAVYEYRPIYPHNSDQYIGSLIQHLTSQLMTL